MAGDKIKTDDIGKTGVLLGIGNMLLTPLYWADARLGVTAALIGTGFFLYKAHEVGKNQSMSQFKNIKSLFFTDPDNTGKEVHNAFANIALGGAKIFDELLPEKKL